MNLSKKLSDRKMLMIGFIGALITMLGGELPLGWYENPASGDMLTQMIGGYGSITTLRLACGVLFGSIGIALQAFGYEAISNIIGKDGKNPKAAKAVHIGALACGFLGPVVHDLCIALMYVCRSGDVDEAMSFMLWLVSPICIIFMPIYMVMMVVMFVTIIRKKTVFPAWAAFLNLAIIMLLVNMIAEIGGNSKVFHSIEMANMGLGSLICFIVLYLLYQKQDETV